MKLCVQIDRNTDTDLIFAFADASGAAVDLGGFTLRMQVRPSAVSSVLFDELSTDNGRLIVEEGGRVRALISAQASMSYPAGVSKFDILATAADGRQTRIAEGEIDTSLEVTR